MPKQNRREFFQTAGAGLASARLIGTALAPGMFLSDAVGALKGGAQSLVIPTHEHWGDIDERIDFPNSWQVNVMEMAGHAAPVLSRDEIRKRVQSPVGTRPLRELAAGKKRVVVTFDDLTRPTPTYDVAPLVAEELRAAGVADENILFMGSYGTHRNLEQDEVERKLGKDIPKRYPWINHNIFDNLKEVGTTTRKNRIKINDTFMAADLKVTISGIKVHSFAGYGGGAKAILPGVAWIDTIQYNHGTIAAKNKTTGQVKTFKNEARLDMIEAARFANVDFSVQILINGHRKVVGVYSGDIVEAHHAAVRMANKHYRTPTLRDADIVVANGYPQNTQATHALGWFNRSLKDGGTAVLVIQHPQGMSSWHFLNQRTSGAGGRTYWDMLEHRPESFPKGQLLIYSQYLEKQEMVKFPKGTQFARNWDEVTRQLMARHKSDARVAVYPYAGIQHAEIDLDG
ncbi:MAG TPA: lactate racemase domain-containing protein [Bryobacterales bacterium]|nr:lactate racemase domain-containing protein [Bryobacterales bacterium]